MLSFFINKGPDSVASNKLKALLSSHMTFSSIAIPRTNTTSTPPKYTREAPRYLIEMIPPVASLD